MANTELEKSAEIRNSTIEHQEETPVEINHEIECPRCYAIMYLCSDFVSLFYSCEECSFILYTIKKNYLPS
jgi:DNA-directed RNA polymerase subunit M/transcription elongation factor TFIIS